MKIDESWNEKQWASQFTAGKLGAADAVIALVLELRTRADRCERVFIQCLRGLEISGLWRHMGDAGSFEKFIQHTIGCKPERYRHGALALQQLGVEMVDFLGMTNAKIVARVEDPARRQQAAEILIERTKANGGPLSEQTANAIVNPSPIERKQQKETAETAMRSENEVLRSEVDRLRRFVVSLGYDPETLRAVGRREKDGDRSQSAKSAKAKSKKRPGDSHTDERPPAE